MIYDYHVVFGVLGVIVGLAGYVPYFRDIIVGTTKPHVFTWFVWGLLNAIAAAAQVVEGGGAGVLVTGFTSFICLVIAGFALFRGEKDISWSDWVCLFAALIGIVLWVLTKEALLAVIIVSITDTIAFVPTIRKAYHKPYEETASSYAIATVRSLLGLLALQSYAPANWLYLAAIFISDAGFTIMLLIRRRQLRGRQDKETASQLSV